MKTMINTRLIAIALVASFTVAFASPAMAGDEKKVIPVELKFIGNVKNQPLFHMTFYRHGRKIHLPSLFVTNTEMYCTGKM
ncbi:MAG: hypothetical protein WDO71_13960 [Bacteroidota bacterium]